MNKPKTTLHIKFHTFPVQLADNAACGGVENEFKMSCDITSRGLNQDGFVVEVGSFIKAVEAAYYAHGRMLKASCEELAGGVVFLAHRILGDSLVKMHVMVNNLTGWVAVVWEQGEEVPLFPREATDAEVEATEKARRCGASDARYRC